ncbi:MAG TPA: aldo/keto reductase [Verrucomicrobiota bacterium]|nr:aldo/keto reductase [Verrucomicrobiota bacterium]
MQTLRLGPSSLEVSRLVYGGWRLAGTWNPAEVTAEGEARGRAAVRAAVEAGFTGFDLADIYCQGECERIFGEALRESPGLRERLVIVSKCGIRRAGDPAGAPYRYDFSAEHIVASCEASLHRLGIGTLDVYLLHRPDFLMDPAEVAGAFDRLRRAGKVREFGVSNFAPSQVAALQAVLPFPLVVNQVEFSLAHLAPLTDGTLEQCLERRLTPMAWSPLAGGKLGDGAHRVLPAQEHYDTATVNFELDAIAAARGATRMQVALAWLLRHPAGVMPVIGTTEPTRIREAAQADGHQLTREEWYRLLVAARGEPLP